MCPVTSEQIFGLYLFEDNEGNTVTVTSDRYVDKDILNNFFIPSLDELDIDTGFINSQQNGTIPDLFINCMNQYSGNQRWTSTSFLIVHLISPFIKLSSPPPHHLVAHYIISINLTDISMNFNRFNVLCI